MLCNLIIKHADTYDLRTIGMLKCPKYLTDYTTLKAHFGIGGKKYQVHARIMF